MLQRQFPVYQESDTLYVSAFGIERVGQNAKWGLARRTEGILHYVISGEGVFNGHPVQENQGFYIPPSSLAEYYPSEKDPWNYFWINVSPEFANRYIQPTVNADSNGIFDYDFKGKLMTIIDKIMSANSPMGSIESLAYAFSVLKLHTPQTEVSRSRQHVLRAKNYIENSLNQRISVYDVADAVSIHDRYLYSLFIQYEGISPKEYIIKRKIETASDLLENTGLSVMEIAAATGFPDVYSFSRLFKEKTGVSPTQYRKTV